MPIIYYAAMAVAALVLLVLFIRSELKLNMCYVLVYATVVIANWGYLALASSDVMEEALLANKIAYIGGCLLPFLMFLAVADLCNIRIPNLLTDALLFLDIVLLFCAFTAGHNELFYRSQTLGDFYGTSYLIKEYGPLHTLYILYWVGYMVAITALVVYSLFRKELVSYKTTFILGILLATNVLIYLVERLIKIPIELMPLAYCISTALLLMRLQKINLYDMSSNVLNVLRRRSASTGTLPLQPICAMWDTTSMRRKYTRRCESSILIARWERARRRFTGRSCSGFPRLQSAATEAWKRRLCMMSRY